MQEETAPRTDAADDLEQWRERVFRFVLVLTIAFAFPSLVIFSYSKAEQGRLAVALPFWALYAVFAVLGVSRRIAWRKRALVYLSCLFVAGVLPILEYGFRSQGPLLLLTAITASSVFVGVRASVTLLALSLLVLALSGALFLTGVFSDNASHPLTSLSAWASLTGTFLFIGLCMVATVGVLMRGLETSLLAQRDLVRDLRHQVAAVEAEKGATLHELGERQRAEQLLEQLNAELEQRVSERTQRLAQANDDLKAFSFTVSHDLRAPLRQLGAFVGMLRESAGTQLDSDSDRYLDAISQSAKRMTDMIDDLLRFHTVSYSKLSVADVDLGGLVQEVVSEHQAETRERDVAFEITPLPTLPADRALLKHVFSNLLGNALKYTRPRARAEIAVAAKREDGSVIVSVRDNGVGFDPSYGHRLFQVFQRLHSAHEFEGSGIGLAHVKRIVERHGGRVWATGAVDAGATFYVSLPDSLRPPLVESGSELGAASSRALPSVK